MNSKDYSDIRVELNSNSIFLVKKNSYFILLAMMSLILILTLIFALSMGRYSINFSTIIKVLISKLIDINIDWSITEQQVIESVRMPRILVAGLCGASLALGGSALQGLFRNPLVGPQVIGVSSGAAFGGVIAILLMLPDFLYSYFCFFIWCNCFACCDDDC
ncbi:iron chelate uptake ABC transporter family permease subunit [Photobacterium kishitanii]|uniref:iron chelate uptake ABC transporter family permease subunit n=1 Tax=Photobacterium kishitanii TaxID=318456 RepID=UPI000B1E3F5A|nr:iron chelate uptake ABC transporter family permease subunit [Photobacterium kishitanii]